MSISPHLNIQGVTSHTSSPSPVKDQELDKLSLLKKDLKQSAVAGSKMARVGAELAGGCIAKAVSLNPIGFVGIKIANFVLEKVEGYLDAKALELLSDGKNIELKDKLEKAVDAKCSLTLLQKFDQMLLNRLERMGGTAEAEKAGSVGDAQLELYRADVKAFFKSIGSVIKSSFERVIPPAAGDEASTKEMTNRRGELGEVSKTFKFDGKEIAQETVTRTSTVERRIGSLNAKLEYLNKELHTAKTKGEDTKFIEEKISRTQGQLKQCENYSGSWIGSNASRDVLVGHSFVEGRKRILPIAVNARVQKVKTGAKDLISFQRFGAIWDPRNGLTNLHELKELNQELKSCNGNEIKEWELHKKIDQKQTKLRKMISGKSADQKALIKENIAILENFRPNKSNQAAIDALIEDRSNFLRDQYLEILVDKLKSANEKGNLNEGAFKDIHIGLLNQNAPVDFQQSGWCHIEENQILDMYALFKNMDGGTIEIRSSSDVSGSFIDETPDGRAKFIISAEDLGWKGPLPATITHDTCFMNISVQGYTKNDGTQEKINKEQFLKLEAAVKEKILTSKDEVFSKEQKKEFQQIINDIRTRLEEKKESGLKETVKEKMEGVKKVFLAGNERSSFHLATEIAVISSLVYEMSEGCLSCKDRGGTIAEMIAIRVIELELKNLGTARADNADAQAHIHAMLQRFSDDPEAQARIINEIIQKFSNEILDENSPCVLVVEDCTGVKVAKVDVFELNNMDPEVRINKLSELAIAAATGGLNVKPENKPS